MKAKRLRTFPGSDRDALQLPGLNSSILGRFLILLNLSLRCQHDRCTGLVGPADGPTAPQVAGGHERAIVTKGLGRHDARFGVVGGALPATAHR